jgi:PucR C-terminal helix-turn-helix domain
MSVASSRGSGGREEDDVSTRPMDPPLSEGGLTDQEVMEFFDRELVAATRLELLVERASTFAGCSVGVASPDGDTAAQAPPAGHGHDRDPSPRVTRPLPGGGLVWVSDLAPAVTELFLSRLAVAVAVARQREPADAAVTSPLDVLIDRQSSEQQRAEAAKQLGLSGESLVRIVVCNGPEEGIKRLADAIASIDRVVTRVTSTSGLTVLLVAGASESLNLPGIPTGVRAAYGVVTKVVAADVSYANAFDAFRFTLPSPSDTGPYPATAGVWTNGALLSGLAALSRLRRDQIETIPDIAILQGMTEKYGEHILEILEAYATNDSLRKAAAGLFIHHNTLNYWVQKASAELGYSLTEPYRRAQLFISLCLFRLWRDHELTH